MGRQLTLVNLIFRRKCEKNENMTSKWENVFIYEEFLPILIKRQAIGGVALSKPLNSIKWK